MTGAVLPLGITMGEPAGIGGEIVLKAWLRRRAGRVPFFAIDDPDRLRNIASRLELRVPVCEIDAPESAGQIFGESLPVLPSRCAYHRFPASSTQRMRRR
jgi:4-hydroxythreonine-4-phosphate dehydrogenase